MAKISAPSSCVFDPATKQNGVALKLPREIVLGYPTGEFSVLMDKVHSELIRNAQSAMSRGVREHVITAAQIIKTLEIKSNNYAYIYGIGIQLQRTLYIHSALNSGSRLRNEGIQMLDKWSWEPGTGVIRYSFKDLLQDIYTNPKVFSPLLVEVYKNFRCKYSKPLYELINANKLTSSGSTGWLSVADVRVKIRASSESLSEYKFLKALALNKALKEINAVSDIEATMEEAKEGKVVTKIRFFGKLKHSYVIRKEATHNESAYERLSKIGCGSEEIMLIFGRRGDEAALLEAIQKVENELVSGLIVNGPSRLLDLLAGEAVEPCLGSSKDNQIDDSIVDARALFEKLPQFRQDELLRIFQEQVYILPSLDFLRVPLKKSKGEVLLSPMLNAAFWRWLSTQPDPSTISLRVDNTKFHRIDTKDKVSIQQALFSDSPDNGDSNE